MLVHITRPTRAPDISASRTSKCQRTGISGLVHWTDIYEASWRLRLGLLGHACLAGFGHRTCCATRCPRPKLCAQKHLYCRRQANISGIECSRQTRAILFATIQLRDFQTEAAFYEQQQSITESSTHSVYCLHLSGVCSRPLSDRASAPAQRATAAWSTQSRLASSAGHRTSRPE